MYILKAFFEYPSLANNTPGIIAPIGELSADSLTFSKEVGTYQDSLHPQTTLKTFTSREDDTIIEVPEAYVDTVLELGQWLYEQATLGNIPDDHIELAERLTVEFESYIGDVLSGGIVNGTGANFRMPQWVSFYIKTATGAENFVRIWFTNAAFSTQYDEYSIDVVPPVEDLNTLFNSYNIVKQALDSRSQTELFLQIQEKRDKFPETYLVNETYDWVDRSNSAFTLPTHWALLIYGPAGNNPDSKREAIIDFLLDNSSHPREEWAQILPDLFATTEFIITPYWDKYSTGNLTITTGLYSPTSFTEEPLQYALRTNTKYTQNHIRSCLCSSVAAYKSIGFAVVGGAENRDGITRFDDKFPDYIVTHSSQPDFNRMSEVTRTWAFNFLEMLKIAEEMTPWSVMPNLNFNRLIRGTVMYIAWTYRSTTYLVAAKYEFENLQPNPL